MRKVTVVEFRKEFSNLTEEVEVWAYDQRKGRFTPENVLIQQENDQLELEQGPEWLKYKQWGMDSDHWNNMTSSQRSYWIDDNVPRKKALNLKKSRQEAIFNESQDDIIDNEWEEFGFSEEEWRAKSKAKRKLDRLRYAKEYLKMS